MLAETAPELARFLGILTESQPLLVAAVLGALCGRGLRGLLWLLIDRRRGWLVAGVRVMATLVFLALGAGYALLTASMMRWDATAVSVAGAAAAVMMVDVPVRLLLRRPVRLSPFGVLARLTLILGILLGATLTLMRSGFLALTTDRPVLRIELTGETRPKTVRFAPPDQPMQELPLVEHRVILRTPEGAAPGTVVGEAWVYGDEVAIKGRVLRLSPLLNVAGVDNLFELQYLHNGYFTAERHNLYPHQAVPVVGLGPLAVHPKWQPLRDRLLARWEGYSAGERESSDWAIRSATTESTYFPLVDSQGRPLARTYALVLTPGGLTAR